MIRYKKDKDNIVTLTLNMEGRNLNIINHHVSQSMVPIFKHLEAEKSKRKLKGIIITSAKKNFLVGGDLDYLYQSKDAAAIFELSQNLQKLYRQLEQPGVPVVAAINGTALGSGFGLALACHHRVVIDRPSIRLGHPEVKLGIMPGGGEIIRLMWLLGVEKAFHVLNDGQLFSPKEALRIGIVSALATDKNDLIDQAKKWINENQKYSRPWDTKEGEIPGGTAQDMRIATTLQKLAAGLAAHDYNNFPAPQTILNTLSEGSKVDFDTACRIESRNFTQLIISNSSKNMIKAFWFDLNTIREGISRPKGFGKFRPKKVGVIGAGQMGSGIGLTCLKSGIEVVLKDVSKAIAERGKEYIASRLTQLLDDGRITDEEKSTMLGRLKTTGDAADFATCDLVIEAVFENEALKVKVAHEAEQHLDEYAFLASNTISIPITKLSKSCANPANYVGLHFFPPAEKVPLVEIVRGKNTSEETVARAFDFVKAIKKIPIVAKDNWGFYVARVQNTFILEGITMLQEGHIPALIEQISVQSGMPMGALALADELSLPITLKYEGQAAEHYGNKYIEHPATAILNKMTKELDRKGKAKKAGFYNYDDSKKATGLWENLTEHFPTKIAQYTKEEISERLLFVQVIEAVWCLQEGIIQTVAEANLGSIYGWGFPAFRGGVIQYINDYGMKAFVERCAYYEQVHGPRFKVPKLLKKKVAAGEGF